MRSLKFFEKSYIITLLLFLLLLNTCIFSLAFYTHSKSVAAAERICISEHFCIIEAFERDYDISNEQNDRLLIMSYCTFYSGEGISLSFSWGDTAVYSNVPENFPVPEEGKHISHKAEGKRHIIISESACDGKYTVTYAKDISYLDDELKQLALSFGAVSVLASAILALSLYFIQKKLFVPLEKLRNTTKEISAGNLKARADDSGQDEFASLATDFNAMSDKITAQMTELKNVAEQRQRMLDNLGHEMRTPLTSIHASAEYAFRNALDEETRLQTMLDIMSESQRLKRISGILTDAAFIRENGIKRAEISAKDLVENMYRVFNLDAEKRNVFLKTNISDFVIEGDITLLEMVMANLIENALHACRVRGFVEIGSTVDGRIKTLYVRDNGIGMTKEQLKHVTEPFYRTDKARSRSEGGTGLGLALCKHIADAHGAVLEFESVPGEGTAAYLRFGGENDEK